MTNVAHDFSREISFGAKDASGDEVTLDFAKPDLNLVEPGGVDGRVVQGQVGISAKELADPVGFVGREVIDDDMNGFTCWLAGDELVQKGNELGAGVPRGRLAKDLAALGFQRSIERESAMAKILETMTLRPTRRERQHGVESVESLDGALFIHAEDCGIERRLEIESDDISCFGLKIGIIALHVMAQTMRLQPEVGPHPCYAGLICAQHCGQRSRAPVGGATLGFAMQGPVDDARVESLVAAHRLASPMPAEESRESFGCETLPPQSHRIDAAALLGARLAQRAASGQSKYDSCPAAIFTSGASALGHLLKSPSFRWTDYKSSCHMSHDTSTVSELNDSLH